MVAPRPRGEAAGPGSLLILNRIRPAIRPARFARRGGASSVASSGGALSHRPPRNPAPAGLSAQMRLGPHRHFGAFGAPAVRGASHCQPPPAGKCSGAPSPHNRFHPWRNLRAINRASTMEHPALVGISGLCLSATANIEGETA